MYHSINIGDKNTFDDWHLIYPGRPIVNPPIPKMNYVDILGKNGSLDYTNALVKTPRYSDREGTWEFIILNPGDVDSLSVLDDRRFDPHELSSEITSYCNGRKFDKVWLEDDPDYYYVGRVWVSGIQTSSGWSRIILSYRFEPFKYKMISEVHRIEVAASSIAPTDDYVDSIVLPKNSYPTQLIIKLTTTAAMMVTFLKFNNPELGIDKGDFDLGFSTGIGQINDFNKDLSIMGVLVSNMSGENECEFGIICPDGSSGESGPVTVEYWWNEAIV